MKYLYQNKHWSINKEYNLDKLLYLMIDRPNQIFEYNNGYIGYIWKDNKGYYHRDYDLPEYFCDEDYGLYWYKNSKQHREKSKPACISHDGIKEYWLYDQLIKKEKLK